MNNISVVNLNKPVQLNFNAKQMLKRPPVQTDRFEPSFEGGKSKIAAGIGAFALLIPLLGLIGCSKEPAQKPEKVFYYEDPARINAEKTEKIISQLNELTGEKITVDDIQKCLMQIDKNKIIQLTNKIDRSKTDAERLGVLVDYLVSEGIDRENALKITEIAAPKIEKIFKETTTQDIGIMMIYVIAVIMLLAAGSYSLDLDMESMELLMKRRMYK